MHDGIHLSANIFLPEDHGRFPTVLVRTPYGKGIDLVPNWQALVDRGYAVMVEDVRGRYESEGAFAPFTQEPPDANDTLNWIARQSWSDGKVGMTGGSYLGITQWKAALTGNPHLKAIFPVVSGYDDYFDRFYSTGGAMKLGNRLEWMSENLRAPGYRVDFTSFVRHLPLRTADIAATGLTSEMFQTALNHPTYDAFWRSVSTREQLSKVKVPVFAIGGWYDNFAESDLAAYSELSKRSSVNRILIGPWPHNMSKHFEGIDYGPDSEVPVRDLVIDWFDQWLMGKDTPLNSQPPVQIFLMGANHWVESRTWPPEGSQVESWYLGSGGSANTLNGDGALNDALPSPKHAGAPADHFVYNPRDPVPTRGGSVCCNPEVFPWGPMDQREIEQRNDVLVYTSKSLAHDLQVAGPVSVQLYITTTARDTDFTAKLVDVYPDGTARNLTDGILRLRYRNSLDKAELAAPGTVYPVTVDAGVTGNVFRKGHKIRLEISSSNFPRFDRNPNTGKPIVDETHLLSATQTILHDAAHVSRLDLTVIRPKREATLQH
jgi:putative CocE/NonD family hydrolase